MLIYLYHLTHKTLNLIKMNFYIILILSFLCLNIAYCEIRTETSDYSYRYCSNFLSISDNCFFNKLIFNHKSYQAHNFAINKKGDLVIQFTEDNKDDFSSSRLFYGLTKEGRYFFSNETSYTYECDIDIDQFKFIENGYNYNEYYNTKNLFVSLKNEIKEKSIFI